MTPIRKFIIGAAALASTAVGAVGIASIGTANAASPVAATASTTVGTPAPSGTSSTPAVPAGPHVANGITETVLTGDTATSVEAAVKAAYPDATITRMETDAEGAKYEAHITKADGSDATVKLDASFAITGTVTGHG